MNKLLESLEPYTTETLGTKSLKFRNYVPRNKDFNHSITQAPTTVAEVELNVEREVKNTLREFEVQQKEPLVIAPKKANWDLKRNFEAKLQKINKKTEEAIIKLIKSKKNK
jgi:coiled-coil domain-containing protein 12